MSKLTKVAKKVFKRPDPGGTINTIIRAGQANPGPPLGPIIGQVNLPTIIIPLERSKDVAA
uniref:Uncharacterized protein n=1 Tax=Eptatretus burgeri TaxID=7764 RepID=A0A8C4QXS1_EPTBU